jgi:hypothetical protein
MGMLDTVGEAVMISGYINFCFFVSEVAMIAFGPQGETRHVLDTMAHILAGPIAFLGFLNAGFTGSFFFFLALWHFLCDAGRARPSYIRVFPRTREEAWVWFERCGLPAWNTDAWRRPQRPSCARAASGCSCTIGTLARSSCSLRTCTRN